MTVTVQEAEVLFTASGISKVESASSRAKRAMDSLASAGSASSRVLANIGTRGVAGLRGISSAASSAAMSMGKVAAAGASIGAAGVVAAGGAMLKMAADAETLNTQFKVLTGSQETATQLMSDIDKFAASTPFQKMEIADAARQLLAFGGSANTAVDELRMLGDIAAGTGQPIGELAELYGKAKVQGRLFGEDINQLTGRGIPIIQALAKEFGVSESQVKKLVEEGKVGFPEMQRALAGMTGPGGKFAGMMDEMSQTTAGKFSTFTDNVKMLAVTFGNELLPYANEFLDWATQALSQADEFAPTFREALSVGREWFDDLVNGMQDIGVVAGVVVDDFDTLWAGLFQDIPNYAKAAFDWILENSRTLIANMIEMAKNAPTILDNVGRNLGEKAAYSLGLSDEVLQIDPLAGVQMAPLTEFQAPQLSNETNRVLTNIDERLAADRAQRDQPAEPVQVAMPLGAAAAAQSFVSQDRTAMADTGAKAATVQRGDAASVFKRMQDAIGGKQLKIAEKQLDAQQELVEIGRETIQAVSGLGGAFIPVLG